MGAIYIGGRRKTKSGFKWKLWLTLGIILAVGAWALKVTAPTLVEQWINRNGSGKNGYAFSIREVDFSLKESEVILKDVKVFHPVTATEFLESPELTIKLNLPDLLFSPDKKIAVSADQVDLILSKDLSSEVERIKTSAGKKDPVFLETIDGKVAKLNIIEQKVGESRTVLSLNDVTVKVKNVTPVSINRKTEFSVTSGIADGGRLSLTGKTHEENGRTPWSIQGTLKQVSSEIFNRIAGDKLPFTFNEENLSATISAHSENGTVTGEISPEIHKVNLLEERPGIPARSIARLLNEELSFTLPFTLKNELSIQYQSVYQKLKNYRKPAGNSLWPF